MPEHTQTATSPDMPPPGAQLLQIATAFFPSAAVFVIATLDIPEKLTGGPKTAEELAAETETDASALYRVLRAVAAVGVLSESADGKFSNTPMSETLRDSAPDTTRQLVLWMCEEPHWRVYGHLLESVKTGKPAWDSVHGEPIFASLFGSMRELGDTFNRAMTSYSLQTIPAILAAYDFSPFAMIADIAGGYGHLLGAILKQYPGKRGVLFDLPVVLEGAPAMLESYGVADRVELVAGDFTEAIPVTADCYILKHIIHDWYDDKNRTILGNIRSSMPDDAKLLIIDAVVPPPGEMHFSKFLDLEMLLLPGGMERTAEQFDSLLASAGFRMTQIVPTPSPIGIVEAVKA